MNHSKQFELLADRVLECRSKRRALVAEIRRRVKYIKIKAGCNDVPVDLFELTRFMKIIDIQEIPLANRGRLLREKNGMIIQINNTLSSFDKLSTIAHELSHLIVEDKYLHLIPQRVRRSESPYSLPQKYTEELCEEAAAEMILPLEWLRDCIRGSSPSLKLIQSIVSRSNTSIDFVVARICDDGLWSCRFLWWHKEKERIYAIKSYPFLPIESLIWIEPANHKSSLILRCFFEQKYLDGKETLRIRDESYDYRIQCLPLNQTDVLSMMFYSQ
jgi:Zn-dependent peptidase ImmA (M78 family)